MRPNPISPTLKFKDLSDSSRINLSIKINSGLDLTPTPPQIIFRTSDRNSSFREAANRDNSMDRITAGSARNLRSAYSPGMLVRTPQHSCRRRFFKHAKTAEEPRTSLLQEGPFAEKTFEKTMKSSEKPWFGEFKSHTKHDLWRTLVQRPETSCVEPRKLFKKSLEELTSAQYRSLKTK